MLLRSCQIETSSNKTHMENSSCLLKTVVERFASFITVVHCHTHTQPQNNKGLLCSCCFCGVIFVLVRLMHTLFVDFDKSCLNIV